MVSLLEVLSKIIQNYYAGKKTSGASNSASSNSASNNTVYIYIYIYIGKHHQLSLTLLSYLFAINILASLIYPIKKNLLHIEASV